MRKSDDLAELVEESNQKTIPLRAVMKAKKLAKAIRTSKRFDQPITIPGEASTSKNSYMSKSEQSKRSKLPMWIINYTYGIQGLQN